MIDYTHVPEGMKDEVKQYYRRAALDERLNKESKIRRYERLRRERREKISKVLKPVKSILGIYLSTGNVPVDISLNLIQLLAKIDAAYHRKIKEEGEARRKADADRIKDWRERGLFGKGYWDNLKEIQAYYQSRA